MKSMIFAAGLGTRLKPITDTLPKALAPLGGKPLLEHVARKLMASGINEAVVNVHHFADRIEDWIGGQDWIVREPSELSEGRMLMQVSDERHHLLETGGAVLHARRFLDGCGHFLIHNVDIYSNADLGWFASNVRPDALATLLVSERKTTRFLLFRPDSMRLVGWLNTDQNDWHLADPSLKVEDCRALAFSGIHIMSDKVFDLMEEYIREKNLVADAVNGTKFPIMSFYMWAASRMPVHGVVAENLEFIDVGKIETLEKAEALLSEKI